MPQNWAQKTVLVSGGSKGLGAKIAHEAARQHARVLIVGRNSGALESTALELKDAGADDVICIQANAIELATNQTFLNAVEHSGIDLLINAIGRSDRGRLTQLTPQELEAMFHDNVSIGLSVTQTCLPYLERNQGAVVNIGSLAGLISAPYLGAYCASKFALTALTRQWRAELRDKHVHFMLVSTGPIARDDSHKRYNDLVRQRGDLPEEVKAPGGGTKLKSIDPEMLSRLILANALKRTPEIVVPFKARILAAIAPLFPSLADYLLKKNTGNRTNE